MSTLWTPGGERPIRRQPPDAGSTPSAGRPPAGKPSAVPPGAGAPAGAGSGEEGLLSEEEARAQMEELRDQLARTPAEVVVANHAFGLFELAALHLSLQPAQLGEARLAIDALGALVDGLGSRLGEAAPELGDALAQLRMAYVQIHGAQQAADPGEARPGSGPAAGGTAPAAPEDER